MIGSLIYFGLYPLTKLISTLSEVWWNSRPVYINGKALRSGGRSPSRRPNEQQSTWLDWWYNTEPCEAMEGFPLKKEQMTPARQKEAFDMLKSPEMKKQKFQDKRKTSHGMEAADNQPMVSNSAAEERFTDHMSSYLAVDKTKERQAYHSAATSRVRADVAKETGHTDCTLATQSPVRISTSKSMPNETGGTESLVSAGSPVYNLGALLADSHTPMLKNHTSLQSAPTGWHFPVGVGLSEVAYYPIGHFPGMSYYPAYQESSSFEEMWRVWEDFSDSVNNSLSPYEACTDPESKFEFSVLSYNILAQDLLEANSSLYTHCPEEVLMWENRFNTIVRQLQTWQPDIICLQEVQENHFLMQMQPVLTELGYNCVYKRRTGSKTDGCTVCYQAKRFTQLSVSLLEFRREGIELLDRDNVGIVLLLQPIAAHCQGLTFRPICVANTHLLFNPRRGEVKLAQLAIVLAEIDSMVRKCKVNGHDCETILCGDLNSVPNMPLYQLITTGQLYYHGLPTWMVSGQQDLSHKMYHRRLYAPLWPSSLGINDNCQYSHFSRPCAKESGKLQYSHDFLRQLRFCPAACVRPPDLQLIPGVTDNTPTPDETQTFTPRNFRNTICHSLNLKSAYSQNIAGTRRSAVSTLHSGGAAMVDYIFYSAGSTREATDKKNGLKLLGRLALLSEDDLWSLNGLPNQVFPSDHLSLLAKFQLC